MFEWEKNAHLYQSYKITSRCYINENRLFLWEWRKKIFDMPSAELPRRCFIQKKALLCAVKKMRTFFLFIAKTGSITSTVYTNFEFRMSHYYYRKFSPLTKFIWGIKKARIPLSISSVPFNLHHFGDPKIFRCSLKMMWYALMQCHFVGLSIWCGGFKVGNAPNSWIFMVITR